MKKTSPSQNQVVFFVAAALLLVSAIIVRFVPVPKAIKATDASALESVYPQGQQESAQTASGTSTAAGLPEPTSAVFKDGDALKALGPNWTFVKQEEQRFMSSSFVAGTAPNRESVVQLIKNPKVGLDIEESTIVDQAILTKALAQKDVKKTTVAGRIGHLVPMGSLESGNAFVLTGTSTILILQDANTALWPDSLDPEVEMYVRTVRVP